MGPECIYEFDFSEKLANRERASLILPCLARPAAGLWLWPWLIGFLRMQMQSHDNIGEKQNAAKSTVSCQITGSGTDGGMGHVTISSKMNLLVEYLAK